VTAAGTGPSTIVGSAAFNLFVISAVCVLAIPEGKGWESSRALLFTPPAGLLFTPSADVLSASCQRLRRLPLTGARDTSLRIWLLFTGEGRKIKSLGVFGITASFSVAAYVWLALILLYFSPNIVEVWEGVATLLLFPLLVPLPTTN
jgi:hypothetical protein